MEVRHNAALLYHLLCSLYTFSSQNPAEIQQSKRASNPLGTILLQTRCHQPYPPCRLGTQILMTTSQQCLAVNSHCCIQCTAMPMKSHHRSISLCSSDCISVLDSFVADPFHIYNLSVPILQLSLSPLTIFHFIPSSALLLPRNYELQHFFPSICTFCPFGILIVSLSPRSVSSWILSPEGCVLAVRPPYSEAGVFRDEFCQR